jgi:hypothetical protein
MFKMHQSSSQASPSRSMKSGNSTSSTNSTRSMSNGSTVKATNGVPLKKAQTKIEISPQGSFDEVDDAPVPEGLVKCSICKRNFAEDRLEKHQVICQKTKSKKRKVYDASKKRVQVTDFLNLKFSKLNGIFTGHRS